MTFDELRQVPLEDRLREDRDVLHVMALLHRRFGRCPRWPALLSAYRHRERTWRAFYAVGPDSEDEAMKALVYALDECGGFNRAFWVWLNERMIEDATDQGTLAAIDLLLGCYGVRGTPETRSAFGHVLFRPSKDPTADGPTWPRELVEGSKPGGRSFHRWMALQVQQEARGFDPRAHARTVDAEDYPGLRQPTPDVRAEAAQALALLEQAATPREARSP